MTGGPPSKPLGVLVDGSPLADADARALWERFSAWMEEHRGDLAGFAAQAGYASVHPGIDGDRPVLRASKTLAQLPYATVPTSGGSPARHGGPAPPDRQRAQRRNRTQKRHK